MKFQYKKLIIYYNKYNTKNMNKLDESYESDEYDDIKKKIMEYNNINNIIDEKCLDIYNENNENENKITKYKLYMENVILEYHKLCKLIYTKN